MPLLKLDHVSKHFKKGSTSITAVNDVSFQIMTGEIVGLVGESGSGKSTIGKLILMLETPSQGAITFDNTNLHALTAKEKLKVRRDIQMVFQNPYGSLNPRMTLKKILEEPLDIHRLYTGNERSPRLLELLDMVGLKKDQLMKYPHEFSGGQRQRISIARALSINPKFLVCDEPLTALDMTTQAQIIRLLQECQKHLQLTMLFISHDLAAVDMLADRLVVLSKGVLAED